MNFVQLTISSRPNCSSPAFAASFYYLDETFKPLRAANSPIASGKAVRPGNARFKNSPGFQFSSVTHQLNDASIAFCNKRIDELLD